MSCDTAFGKGLQDFCVWVSEAAVKNVAFNNLQQKEIAAIIGKATAIDTNKRYMSMRELQMDLHAVLHKTTISALHNTPAYKVKKFIVRQPWLSALAKT